MNYHFEDFTETEYRELLRLTKKTWRFIAFPDFREQGRVCLWRHDIDVSIHRAHKLAQIEEAEGVKATYFIHLHSKFYNSMEDEVVELVSNILEMGHMLGVHFDPEFYSDRLMSSHDVLSCLNFERQILQRLFGTEPLAFSLHHPENSGNLDFNGDEIAGMIYAFGPFIRANYNYCSDSNGYWRFRRLKEVLESATDPRLHVLTHPEWWQEHPMAPGERILRAIDGHARRVKEWYERKLAETGRKNVERT